MPKHRSVVAPEGRLERLDAAQVLAALQELRAQTL
jgi:hypothetical protein